MKKELHCFDHLIFNSPIRVSHVVCEECGETIAIEDAIEIDGDYYCAECASGVEDE
jgi:formylmethanofuran dehydrogenase subunit E